MRYGLDPAMNSAWAKAIQDSRESELRRKAARQELDKEQGNTAGATSQKKLKRGRSEVQVVLKSKSRPSPLGEFLLHQMLTAQELCNDFSARSLNAKDADTAYRLAGRAAQFLDISFARLKALQKLAAEK